MSIGPYMKLCMCVCVCVCLCVIGRELMHFTLPKKCTYSLTYTPAYEIQICVFSHTYIHPHMIESCHIYEWATSPICRCHIIYSMTGHIIVPRKHFFATYMHESCHVYESCPICATYHSVLPVALSPRGSTSVPHICMSHVTYMNAHHVTCEGVMSHMNASSHMQYYQSHYRRDPCHVRMRHIIYSTTNES